MTTRFCAINAWVGSALMIFGGLNCATAAQAATKHAAMADIDGTYELVKRVMSDGSEILPPAIEALYTLTRGRGNFNLYFKQKDGALASESTISRYTLTAGMYCEWIMFTTRNNLDKPGVSNEPPAVAKHCGPVTRKNRRIAFEPAGEHVVLSFSQDGFTASAAGQFVDHWKKLR